MKFFQVSWEAGKKLIIVPMTTRLFGDEDENSYLWACNDVVALMIVIPIFAVRMTSESQKSPRRFKETVLDLHSLKINKKTMTMMIVVIVVVIIAS